MNDKLDNDLHDLLNELDEEETTNGQVVDPDLPPPATDERDVTIEKTAIIVPQDLVEIVPEKGLVDIVETGELLKTNSAEILDACRADRVEVQDVINLMRSKINDAQGDPPRMYVDALTKAVEVKSNVNQTAVKVLEVLVKAAGTSSPKIGTQNNTLVTGGNLELERILADPVDVTDV